MRVMTAIVDFASGDVTRALVIIILTIGTFALLLAGVDVPSVVWAFDGTAIGWYFGVVVGKTTR